MLWQSYTFLHWRLLLARCVASTMPQPRRLQSSVTLSSQRFLGLPLALLPSTLPYKAILGRHLGSCPFWRHDQSISIFFPGFFPQYPVWYRGVLWCPHFWCDPFSRHPRPVVDSPFQLSVHLCCQCPGLQVVTQNAQHHHFVHFYFGCLADCHVLLYFSLSHHLLQYNWKHVEVFLKIFYLQLIVVVTKLLEMSLHHNVLPFCSILTFKTVTFIHIVEYRLSITRHYRPISTKLLTKVWSHFPTGDKQR